MTWKLFQRVKVKEGARDEVGNVLESGAVYGVVRVLSVDPPYTVGIVLWGSAAEGNDYHWVRPDDLIPIEDEPAPAKQTRGALVLQLLPDVMRARSEASAADWTSVTEILADLLIERGHVKVEG